MLVALLAVAHPAPPDRPPDRAEVVLDAGILTRQVGFAVGLGGRLRRRGIHLAGSASFGPRADVVRAAGSNNPAAGFASATVAAEARAGGLRVGLAAHLDTAILDRAEHGCDVGGACRHALWLGANTLPVGMSLAPAAGITISGIGASSAPFSALIAVQPTSMAGDPVLAVPRLDIVTALSPRVGLHGFVGRYGLGIGLGVSLFDPPTGAD